MATPCVYCNNATGLGDRVTDIGYCLYVVLMPPSLALRYFDLRFRLLSMHISDSSIVIQCWLVVDRVTAGGCNRRVRAGSNAYILDN